MDPISTKPWYLSKGFVGPLLTAILFALRSVGIADIDTESAIGVLYQCAEFAGIAFGMLGRAMAKTRLTIGAAEGTPANAPRSGLGGGRSAEGSAK